MKKIYLAGPDVFLSDAVEQGIQKKKLCEKYGFEGLYPLDNEVDLSLEDASSIIFRENINMIMKADIGIFNLTPFRGPSADIGTVLELGIMTGLHKLCYGYTNKYGDYLSRLYGKNGKYDPYNKVFKDYDGMIIENFNNRDNLMIDNSLECFIGPSCEGVNLGEQRCISKLDRFESILKTIKEVEG